MVWASQVRGFSVACNIYLIKFVSTIICLSWKTSLSLFLSRRQPTPEWTDVLKTLYPIVLHFHDGRTGSTFVSVCLPMEYLGTPNRHPSAHPNTHIPTHTHKCLLGLNKCTVLKAPFVSSFPPLAQWTRHKAGCVHRLMGRSWLHQYNHFHTHTFTQRPNMWPPAWTYGESLHLLSMHAHVFTLETHGSYKTKDTGSIISLVLLLPQMVMNNEYDIMIEFCFCFPPLWGPQLGNSE